MFKKFIPTDTGFHKSQNVRTVTLNIKHIISFHSCTWSIDNMELWPPCQYNI